MKTPDKSELDGLVKQMVKKAGLDSPSPNFTDKVLAEIGKIEVRSPALVYKPLITNGFWVLLAVAIACLILYAILGEPEVEFQWFSMVSRNRFPIPELFEIFYQWSAPSSLLYGLLAIVVFVFLQVYLVGKSGDRLYTLDGGSQG